MKIKQKLILSYLSISLVGAIAGWLGIHNMNQVHVGFDRIVDQTIPVRYALDELERSMNDLVKCTYEYVFLSRSRDLFKNSESKKSSDNIASKTFEAELQSEVDDSKLDIQHYRSALAQYKTLVERYFPQENTFLEKIERSSQNIISLSEEILVLEQKNLRSQVFLKQRALDQNRDAFKVTLLEALKHEKIELEERQSSLHTTLGTATQGIFIVSGLNVFLALAVGTFVSFSISNPIEKLKTTAAAFGKGRLSSRTNLPAKDELGLLADSFNQMAEDLERYITDLQQAKENNALLATALEQVTDAIEITDPEAKYLYVNPAFEAITGYTKQDVLGRTPALLRGEQQDLAIFQTMFDTVSRQEIWQGALVSRHKDGTHYDQEVTLSPIMNSEGKLTHILGVKRDITQRKHAEEALRESEERFRLLVTSAPVGIFKTNAQGDCLFVNPRWLTITDLSIEEALGSGWKKALHPEDQERVAVEWFGTTEIGSEFSLEYRFKTPMGRTVWVFGRAVAIRDRNQQIVGYFGTITDITEQKQIEATLREAERRWRTLLESVRLLVIGLDYRGNVEYINPFFQELSGYTPEEVLGKNWFETFLPSHQRQPVKTCFLDILEQDVHAHYQNSILTKSGEERIIQWNNTLLRTPQGEIIGTMSIGEDITQRQAIARIKDEFISVVSHELRTPIAAIQGGLNLLASGLLSTQSDKGRRVIEIATESVDRLALLVNDILEVERLELGKIRLAKQPCNAAELMQKAHDQMQVMARRAGITLSVVPQPLRFSADPDRMIQVLTNLIGNAIKFSDPGSRVWVTVEHQMPQDWIVFTIQDQGRGISAENLDTIFERFHQVDASDARQKGGTGLGLAICRSIVQQHGGKIWVESAVGIGSSFSFALPSLTTE